MECAFHSNFFTEHTISSIWTPILFFTMLSKLERTQAQSQSHRQGPQSASCDRCTSSSKIAFYALCIGPQNFLSIVIPSLFSSNDFQEDCLSSLLIRHVLLLLWMPTSVNWPFIHVFQPRFLNDTPKGCHDVIQYNILQRCSVLPWEVENHMAIVLYGSMGETEGIWFSNCP